MIKFSLIIPVWNVSRDLFIYCLDSVVRELYPASLEKDDSQRAECILVDDCSTDGSWDVCKEYKEKYPELFRIFRNEKNMGNSYSRNFGIKDAQGEWVGFLDNDDFYNYGFWKCAQYSMRHYSHYNAIRFNFQRTVLKPTGWRNYIRKEDCVNVEAKCTWNNGKVSGHVFIWSYILKRSFILKYNIRFPEELARELLEKEGKYYKGEDNYFVILLFNYAKDKIKNVTWFGITHRLRGDSLGHIIKYSIVYTAPKDARMELKRRKEYYLSKK